MSEHDDDTRLDRLLTEALEREPLTTPALRARILERVATPTDPYNRLVRWLTGGPLLVRPAALALVPLAVGFALGVSLPELGAGDELLMETADLVAFVSIEDFANE